MKRAILKKEGDTFTSSTKTIQRAL